MAIIESLEAIATAEADILVCMQTFLCTTLEVIAPVVAEEISVTEDKVNIAKRLLCAMTAKESSIGEIINSIANTILADKGLVPGCCSDDKCEDC